MLYILLEHHTSCVLSLLLCNLYAKLKSEGVFQELRSLNLDDFLCTNSNLRGSKFSDGQSRRALQVSHETIAYITRRSGSYQTSRSFTDDLNRNLNMSILDLAVWLFLQVRSVRYLLLLEVSVFVSFSCFYINIKHFPSA